MYAAFDESLKLKVCLKSVKRVDFQMLKKVYGANSQVLF